MTVDTLLLNFDFGGGDDVQVDGGVDLGEVDGGGLPTLVAEDAAGGAAFGGDVADELEALFGIGAGGFGLGVGAFDAVDDDG